jgi:hypothetical protein
MSDQPIHWLQKDARRIPDTIRKEILENRFIDIAVPTHDFNTPFEYLFDVYEQFVDVAGQYNDYACAPCRQKIFEQWKLLKPLLEELENDSQ